MLKVAVLGSTGMLGSTLTRVLEREKLQIIEYNRLGLSVTGNNESIKFAISGKSEIDTRLLRSDFDYMVNCIGLIRQLIDVKNPSDVSSAWALNSEFMIWLDKFSMHSGIQLIQIGTDCVFSGLRGGYLENDKMDPIDLYGTTKRKGESSLRNSMLIRSSIIGRELKSNNSLLSWLISQPQGTHVNGYLNHIWNGVTTLQFSEVVRGVIVTENFVKGIQHLVPKDKVSKMELLQISAENFGRSDLVIHPFYAEKNVDRTLDTQFKDRNIALWKSAGYIEAPSIREMVNMYTHF